MKLLFSGLKYDEENKKVNILIDTKDWFEVLHMNGVTQVMNKSKGEYINIKQDTLRVEVVSQDFDN